MTKPTIPNNDKFRHKVSAGRRKNPNPSPLKAENMKLKERVIELEASATELESANTKIKLLEGEVSELNKALDAATKPAKTA